MQTRRFPNRDTAWRVGMNRARRSKRAPIAGGSNTNRIADSRWVQFMEPRFGIAMASLKKASSGQIRVDRPETRCKQARVKLPRNRVVLGIGCISTQRRTVVGGSIEFGFNPIAAQEFLVVVRFGKVAQGIPHGRGRLKKEIAALTVAIDWLVRRWWIFWEREPSARPYEEEPLTVLRNPVARSVENLIVFQHSITFLPKLSNDLFEKSTMGSDGQSADVFKHKIRRVQLNYEADKVMDKGISRIVQSAFADHAESLARSPAEHYINPLIVNSRVLANIDAIDLSDATTDRGRRRKVELVGRGVDRVVLNRRGNVESSLLEAEAHPPSTREQVDAYGSFADFRI